MTHRERRQMMAQQLRAARSLRDVAMWALIGGIVLVVALGTGILMWVLL
jgi:hypothetical protein